MPDAQKLEYYVKENPHKSLKHKIWQESVKRKNIRVLIATVIGIRKS
jgi:hypothetical protein